MGVLYSRRGYLAPNWEVFSQVKGMWRQSIAQLVTNHLSYVFNPCRNLYPLMDVTQMSEMHHGYGNTRSMRSSYWKGRVEWFLNFVCGETNYKLCSNEQIKGKIALKEALRNKLVKNELKLQNKCKCGFNYWLLTNRGQHGGQWRPESSDEPSLSLSCIDPRRIT